MSLRNFLWQTTSREGLADAVFGKIKLRHLKHDVPLSFDLGLDSIGVGYSEGYEKDEYSPPNVVLLGNDSRVEIFSWLKVNSPETFPLSQFARVMVAEDWGIFCGRSHFDRKFKSHGRSDRWASLIVGEIVAQGDGDTDLAKLPLSRAAGCFSNAIAKTHLHYGRDEVLSLCVNRLKFLEGDKRFSKRNVSVEWLTPLWEIVVKCGTDKFELEEALDLLFNILRRDEQSFKLFNIYSSSPELSGNSIEQRVLAFNRVIDELKRLPDDARRSLSCSAFAAIGAFLVGRSTSHEFLARRNLDSFPYISLWYGLLAGIVGPEYWDENWARAAKGVERSIRGQLHWEDSSGYDLCWTEYHWYTSTFEDASFSGIPKLFQRVLSVEVVPGASCQFRIDASVPAVVTHPSLPPVVTPSAQGKIPKELFDVISQFIKLAAKADALTQPVGDQKNLFDKPPVVTKSRAKKIKGS